jgi:predicted SprT family Zn-dependent metalloprotease
MIQKTIDETRVALDKLRYPWIDITFSVEVLPRGTSGLAYPSDNLIKISSDYYVAFPDVILDKTIPHEIVHLYVDKYYPEHKQAHGKEFRKIMQLLGKDPSTYHSMKLEGMERQKRKVTRFVYATKSGVRIGFTVGKHNKVLIGLASFTTKEGEALSFTGEEFYDFIHLFK